MSLTSELRSKDSWVNRFFKDRFPAVNAFVKEDAGLPVKAMATKVPHTCGNARLLGTAFDYRLRIRFGADFSSSGALELGVLKMMAHGDRVLGALAEVWAGAMQELLSQPLVEDEATLARASVILAWLDQGFRSGGLWSDGMRKAAQDIVKHREVSWRSCTSGVDKPIADELVALMRLAETRLPAARAICGPEFDGSSFVGGADADLVIDGCLYEVKTTEKPRDKLPEKIRQLIGYALLDWSDEYGLKKVGFYFSRQGEWKSWPLPELIVRCAGDSTATLNALRNDFRRLAELQRHGPGFGGVE